jgi:hypothetical protein
VVSSYASTRPGHGPPTSSPRSPVCAQRFHRRAWSWRSTRKRRSQSTTNNRGKALW